MAEAPLAQPRNLILGQLLPAIISVAITGLWLLTHPDYTTHLTNREFFAPSSVNGALCMALSLLAQLSLGVVHPPGGATALAGATDLVIVDMSWHYVPVVLVSALMMGATGVLVNNLGRRRYPVYWWAPGRIFVQAPGTEKSIIPAGLEAH